MNDTTRLQGHSDPSDNDVYVHVGRRLRELRAARGETQADIARVIRVSPQQYQKYEDARSKCSLPYLMTLADHFSVSLADILPMEGGVSPVSAVTDPIQTEADLLARLVSAFVKLSDMNEKLRLVQLVEAIVTAHDKSGEKR